MPERPTAPELIELLRKTLDRLEEDEDLSPDDPALIELKHSILRTIAELTTAKYRHAA